MTYNPPYEIFVQAYAEIRKALINIAMTGKYEDAVFVPALMSVCANLSVLADNTDAHLVNEFQKCLFDARTRNIEGNPQ